MLCPIHHDSGRAHFRIYSPWCEGIGFPIPRVMCGCVAAPQVTQPGNAVAAAYLLAEFRKLEVLAQGRDDISVQVCLTRN